MSSFAVDAFCYIKPSKVGAHIKATWTAQPLCFSVQAFLTQTFSAMPLDFKQLLKPWSCISITYGFGTIFSCACPVPSPRTSPSLALQALWPCGRESEVRKHFASLLQ